MIRHAAIADIPAAGKIINDCAEYGLMLHRSMAYLYEHLRDFHVAEEDGKIVGAAIYFFAYYTWVGKSLYLDDLYVKPDHRRRKVGSLLLRKVCELAAREGCRRVRWQVLGWNKDAISFYESYGATISDEWLNCDLDEDGIVRFLNKDPVPGG